MTQLIDLINKYLIEKEYGYTISTYEQCFEELRELAYYNTVRRELYCERRWWREYEVIVKLYDTYWMFIDASADGDMSAQERGFTPNPETIVQVVPVEEVVTITKYVQVAEKD